MSIEAEELLAQRNTLLNRKFMRNGREYVVTWDDGKYLRSTPLDCPTGLTSETIKITDICWSDV